MKKNLRGMTLAALLLSASTSAQADNRNVNGVSASFVGDMSSETPAEYVGSYPKVQPIGQYAPVSVDQLQPASFLSGNGPLGSAIGSGCASGSCDSLSCDGGCDSLCGCGGGIAERLNMCGTDGWMRAEGLIMFMSSRSAPPLITSAAPGDFAIIGDSSTIIEFGGEDELDGGVSGGFRGDIGRYLTDNFGVGGRFTWIGENGDDFALAGDGFDSSGRSIGRPYFFTPGLNTGVAGEDAVLVSQLNAFSGDVEASFNTEIIGAEAYGRIVFCSGKTSRLEFLGGFSHWSIDDELSIRSTSIDNQTLTATTFSSMFDTENEFNGGQIGFDSLITRGRWTARTTSKIHLGNMQQTASQVGSQVDVNSSGAVIGDFNNSILVSNPYNEQTDDVFTFIPEMNFTLGYRFRDHVSFTVGYNFMFFDSVALAGEQVNRNRDTDLLGTDAAVADFDIVDGSLWIQGISLGASVDY